MNEIICGDALATLKTLQSGIVQTCVTSPPYFGLRDYNVEGQIGLEDTPELYIARLVEVFREVRRVLRDDGTLWVNIGDSYASDTKGSGGDGTSSGLHRDGRPEDSRVKINQLTVSHQAFTPHKINHGLKPKDLIGIPWMLAFALRADGWYLRSDIIWHKPNCMPESVTDRPTKAHEYIFLLSKSSDYYYDSDSIREPQMSSGIGQHFRNSGRYVNQSPGVSNSSHLGDIGSANGYNPAGRNKRSVWTVSTMPYSHAHFATFPPKLIEPCILAGSRPGDVVLDPFMGAGTVALVALEHYRQYIGIELNASYVELINKRIHTVQPHLWEVPA